MNLREPVATLLFVGRDWLMSRPGTVDYSSVRSITVMAGSVLRLGQQRGRSSVVEHRTFNPLAVGSSPTALIPLCA